jgi:hypothetical protein
VGNTCCNRSLIKTKTAVACVKRRDGRAHEISRNVRNEVTFYTLKACSCGFKILRFIYSREAIYMHEFSVNYAFSTKGDSKRIVDISLQYQYFTA